MKFFYKCGTPDGKIIEDSLDAFSEKEAKKLLESKGFMVFNIKKDKKNFLSLKKRISKTEIIAFSKMFSVLLKSGIEIINILETLLEQTESEFFRKTLINIIKDVRSGEALADAMKKHPRVFNSFYCSSVEAGEKTGTLENTFERLHIFLNSQDKIRNKIQIALMYPVILLVLSFGVVLFLSLFVLPSFSDMYKSFGKDLPLITTIVMVISNFIKTFWYLIILAIIGIIVLIIKLLKNGDLRLKFDSGILKIKAFHEFIYKQEVIATFRTLSVSVTSGLDILKALAITKNSATNLKIRKDFDDIIMMVSEGQKLSMGLKKHDFPKLAVQMINSGEESNNLEEMLDNVAQFYEEDLENLVSKLMAFVEPILIIVVGFFVGTIIIAILLPIMSMSTAIM